MNIPITPIALTFFVSGIPALAAAQDKEAATVLRVPVADEGEERIHRLRARVRHTTIIMLPAEERILDFVVGDSEYWHLTGAGNVAFLKPLSADAATNVALVCESGRIYSFLASEDAGKPPHLLVRVEAGAQTDAVSVGGASGPAFVARSEVAAYREMAAEATEAARRAQEIAEAAVAEAQAELREAIQAFRAEYPGRLKFEYRLDRNASDRPFRVEAMWHDGRFTYIRARAQEAPALYEMRDGEPALVAFDLTGEGVYVARHVLSDGWLQIGDERARWRFEPRDGLR